MVPINSIIGRYEYEHSVFTLPTKRTRHRRRPIWTRSLALLFCLCRNVLIAHRAFFLSPSHLALTVKLPKMKPILHTDGYLQMLFNTQQRANSNNNSRELRFGCSICSLFYRVCVCVCGPFSWCFPFSSLTKSAHHKWCLLNNRFSWPKN